VIKPVFVKALDHPAEVAGIEAKLDADLFGRKLVAMGEFRKSTRASLSE